MKAQMLTMACAIIIGTFVLSSAQAQTPQQRMKECAAEWGGLKAANQTQGKTYRDFQKECLAKGASAQPASAAPKETAPGQATTPAATTPPAPAATKRAPAAKSAATQPAATGQYKSEAEAKGHCPSDAVVWVNLSSKIYHYSGNKSYGTTKSGAYMCEKDTASAGFRASKNEKRT